MRIVLPLLALAGCDVEGPQGGAVLVGNPPQARVSVAAAVDAVTFTVLELPVVGVYLESCDGDPRLIDLPRTVLGLGAPAIDLDVGVYCAIGLVPEPDASTVLEGEAGGGTWTFTQPLGRILLYGEVDLAEEESVVFELAQPGWIDAAAFGLAPGDHLDLGGADRCTADSLCGRIRGALTDQAGLYTDDDADGAVDTTERDRGEEARGDQRDL